MMKKRHRFIFTSSLIGFIWISGLSCNPSTSDESEEEQPSPQTLFSSGIKNVILEIDYQNADSAPYTGSIGTYSEDTWAIFSSNATRLFQDSGDKNLTIPNMLDQMEELEDITDTDFTVDEILSIADAHRNQKSSGDTATFYGIWFDGYFNDGSIREDVLGVSIGDTGVIAMFKPVISGSSSMEGVQKFVEQSTIVHEFGHAIGLVNNGISLTSEHQDEANGAHCDNPDCTMYYANEGTSAAIKFAQQYIDSGETILFDDNCLADVDAMKSN